MVSPRAKRAAAAHLIDTMGISGRSACRVVGLARSTFAVAHPDQTPQDTDAGLRTWLCAYAKKHPRWGYRRAHHDARAEGWVVNHKKTQRLWREEGLRVPQRRRRKRIGSSTAGDQARAQAPDHVWGIDFQFDRVEDGQSLKVCSIVDEHTRESLGGLTSTSITGERVIALIDQIAVVRGYPLVLRSDNGPEFVCDAIAAWAKDRIGLAFIPPGTPWNNGYVESFHARQRDECLNINSFYSVLHAKVVIADWNHEYNQVRRHSALNYKTPVEYAATCTHRR
jgi:transposase InsO family protein